MNAVEKLQAAIDKLEALRAEGTPGPWTTTWGSATVPAADDLGTDDMELIATLHRTIDAQLAILREVVIAARVEKHWETLVYTETALALTDAILGES